MSIANSSEFQALRASLLMALAQQTLGQLQQNAALAAAPMR